MRFHRLVTAALALTAFVGTGCVFLQRGGMGKGRNDEPSAGSRNANLFSQSLDAREASIAKGELPGAESRWVPIAIAIHNDPGVDAQMKRLAEIDKQWAAKLGGRAPQIVGDGSRVTELTPDETKALDPVMENCPDASPNELQGTNFRYQLKKARAFDHALAEAISAQPRAFHVLWDSSRRGPATDVLTVVVECEQARLKLLATPDPVPEQGLTLSKLGDFEENYVKAFPAEELHVPPAPTTRLPGCSQAYVKIGEDHFGGGKFGDPVIDDAESAQPIKCDKFPKPGHRYAAEAAKLRKSWNQNVKLTAKDVILIPDNAQWEVERDENYPDRITGRTIGGRIFLSQGDVAVRCPRGKTQWDACSEGGSRVMVYFDAAADKLPESDRFEKEGKKVHCQLAAWGAYNLAHEMELTRFRFKRNGDWVEDMKYLPRSGAPPMDEAALFKRADAIKAEARARFNRCGGKGEPPLGAQSDGSDDFDYAVDHTGTAPFRWIE